MRIPITKLATKLKKNGGCGSGEERLFGGGRNGSGSGKETESGLVPVWTEYWVVVRSESQAAA